MAKQQSFTYEPAVDYIGPRNDHWGACALRVADALRRAGRWDGRTPIVIVDPLNLWPALASGDVAAEDLEPGSHYRIEAHR